VRVPLRVCRHLTLTPRSAPSYVVKAQTKLSRHDKSAALALPSRCAQVAPVASLAPHVAAFADAATRSLVASERDSSNLRIEALLMLRQLLVRAAPDAFVSQAAKVTPLVLKAVGDHYYRVSSEGLRTCSALVLTSATPRSAPRSPAASTRRCSRRCR
jgi:hypothetical protein